MFAKLILISTALFSFSNNFDSQHFEANLKNVIIKEQKLETLSIPFTSQAPFGEWSDPRQQDGCEEASVLMTMFWVKGEKLTPEKATFYILEISKFEEKYYGNYIDTSAQDTANIILKGYFGYDNFEIKKNITKKDLIFELAMGNALIIPVNGQKLNNPYFTPPGPERHMLVVKGYDKNTQEFITNDPGTRRGESLRYDENILFNAIRDYPSGDHNPIEKIEKTMIVVEKE